MNKAKNANNCRQVAFHETSSNVKVTMSEIHPIKFDFAHEYQILLEHMTFHWKKEKKKRRQAGEYKGMGRKNYNMLEVKQENPSDWPPAAASTILL